MTTTQLTRLSITTFSEKQDGSRNRQINGFDGAVILVSGERSGAWADAIVERFTRQEHPKSPLSPGGCVRIDDGGIWLCNRADRGWSSSSIHYDSWRELLNEWDFKLGNPQTDSAGVYWPVIAREEGRAL